jgi:hypothetical protein
MTKELKELQEKGKLGVKKVGGKKIEFGPIVQKIVSSGLGWSVKEVHTQLVKGKVTRFRTMKLLNAQCTDKVKKLDRFLENGTFYYVSYQLAHPTKTPEVPALPKAPQ